LAVKYLFVIEYAYFSPKVVDVHNNKAMALKWKKNTIDFNVTDLFSFDRLLVGAPRDGETNSDGEKQGMLYKCRLHNRLPLNQVCTPLIGNNNSAAIRTLQCCVMAELLLPSMQVCGTVYTSAAECRPFAIRACFW